VKRVGHGVSTRAVGWGVVLAAALAYPLAVLAGGGPSFPERTDCVVPATGDGDIALVFGHFHSVVRAEAMRDRVAELGYVHAKVESDGGCGRVLVVVHGYPTLAGARDALGEARSVGLHPTLEHVG
jgi:hypothetical protein